MAKKNKFNFTIIYNSKNEQLTMIVFEPRYPRFRDRRLTHNTISCVGEAVTTLVRTVPHVLNLLWT
jgi:hypothetical protein